ncbi:hypothetical protein ACKWTF_008770 [Chironomus riparius]
MFMPDDKGIPHQIILTPINDDFMLIHNKLFSSTNDKATFWLYTKESKRTPFQLKSSGKDNINNFQFTNKFDGNKPTKIIIHGWRGNRNSDSVQEVKSAYLETAGKDYNVIAVDWEESARDILYFNAAYATKTVGKYVANVINHMSAKHGVNLKDVHIIGHSLGAHVAGVAGSVFQLLSGKKVGRITGTDPAYPLFEDISDKNSILDSSDADFVDVIHTCAGLLGHRKNLGHADFYPNGGEQVQPGCDLLINDLIGTCSHEKSFKFFVATITSPNKYMAQQCSSWKNFKGNGCSAAKIPMGDAVPQNARGEYFLKTDGWDVNDDDDDDDESEESYGY